MNLPFVSAEAAGPDRRTLSWLPAQRLEQQSVPAPGCVLIGVLDLSIDTGSLSVPGVGFS